MWRVLRSDRALDVFPASNSTSWFLTNSTMGNAQSGSVLTRTTVALDSFVAELGGDVIFEKRYVLELITKPRV